MNAIQVLIMVRPARKGIQNRYRRGLCRKKTLYRRGVREFW